MKLLAGKTTEELSTVKKNTDKRCIFDSLKVCSVIKVKVKISIFFALKERDVEQRGFLPKDVIRITLVSGFAVCKSSLKSQNVNHIVEMLIRR